MFAYPGCECGGRVHFELCLPIDATNALGNDRVYGFFVIKNFNFDLRMINSDLKVINYN